MSATTRKGLTFAELQSRLRLREPEKDGLWVPEDGTFLVRHVNGSAMQSIKRGEIFFCSKVTTNGDEILFKVHREKDVVVREANARKTNSTPSKWITADQFELVSE